MTITHAHAMPALETERFGTIAVAAERQFSLVSPILGFEQETRFALLDEEEADSPFLWLQSMQTPSLAFILTNPVWFDIAYQFTLPPQAADLLKANSADTIEVYTLVTIPAEQPEKMTANLMAPIILNRANGLAMQLVMHDAPPEFSLRVRLLPDAPTGTEG